jgi:membrane carboxypeptidase/penicillin-binding protein
LVCPKCHGPRAAGKQFASWEEPGKKPCKTLRVYRSRPRIVSKAASSQTADGLAELMQAAITDGTGRKHFSDAGYHPLLSRLELGGKSGTINDENGAKVDWFVAYAKPRSGSESARSLALAAVVVHDGRFNLSSQELIKRALLGYYKNRLSE